VAYRFQKTNFAPVVMCFHGVPQSTPETPPFPPNWRVGSPSKICIVIGSQTKGDRVSLAENQLCFLWRTLTERDSVSVSADTLYLIVQTFTKCQTRRLAQPTLLMEARVGKGVGGSLRKHEWRLARKRNELA
jgi:hypothetical protein